VPQQPPAIRFAEVVRAVTAVARQRGLQVPVFRSPPRLADVDRTLRRRADGQAVVAIRLTDRPFAAVQSDVIAGVVAVNGLEGQEAGRFRRAAWIALDERPIDLRDQPDDTSAGTGGPAARTATSIPA
jgi:hypothetical protein